MIKSYVTINRCVKFLLNNETNHENMLQSHCKRSRKIKKVFSYYMKYFHLMFRLN